MTDEKRKKHGKIQVSKEELTKVLINTVNQKEILEQQKGFLCMFSGGLDSAGMLHSLLSNEAYDRFDVYVHHIRIIDNENDGIDTRNIAHNIVTYYRDQENIRPFDYKESEINISFLKKPWTKRSPNNIDLVCLIAAQICLARNTIKYVGLGVTKTNLDSPTLQFKSAPEIFESALYDYSTKLPKPTLIYPTQKLTQTQLRQSIPSNIQAFIFNQDT